MNSIVLVFYYCIGKKQHILASLRKAEQNIFVPPGLARGFLKSFLNTPLLKCYLMGDKLRHLWSLGTRGQAIALVMDWIHRATHSRIKPLVDFGKNLRGYVQGLIAAADFKINTSILEGVNNKIKQIKRRAYGFRDDLYFFLKVKAAFHGLPR